MNTSLLAATLLGIALSALPLRAQEGYEISERGFDHRVWTRQVVDVLPTGESITNRHSFVELQDGLHYRSGDQWLQSKAEFELFNGGAVARQLSFQIILSPQLNVEGAIDVLSPQGQRFLTTPRWLNFHDRATGKDAMVAEIKDSIGELAEPSVLIYRDCFTDAHADLRVTISATGFESDVVLHDEGFGVPEDYGLNSATTELEVWHEFYAAAAPRKIQRKTGDGELDQTLDFGDMRMGPGQAFALNRVGETLDVKKTWLGNLEGRTFLVEAVGYARLRPLLDKLKQQARVAGPELKARRMARAVSGRDKLVRGMAALPPKTSKRSQMASIKPGKPLVGPAVVWDYSILAVNKTNYVFQGDTTFLITGPVGLYGTQTVFEAGTVIRYAPTNRARLNIYTPINFQGSEARPVVMNGRDDQSVGESVTAGSLSGFYADTALYIDAAAAGTNITLQHLRITSATNAITINGWSNHVFSHVQMVNCMTGIRATNTTFALRNALFDRVYTNFTGSSATGRVEHLTVDVASHLNFNSNLGLWLTNCLLVAVTNAGSYTGDSVSTASDPTGIFQTVGSGYHYLASSSPYRNVGTTGIDPTLAAALKRMTTYPPIVLTSNFTVNSTLTSQARRDTDAWDLGWHYCPLDYSWSGLTLSSTLTLSNAVAIGIFGSSGLTCQTGSSLISEGTPTSLNRLVRYNAVQEQPVVWGANSDPTSLLSLSSTPTTPVSLPVVRLRFTDVSLMADSNTKRYLIDAQFTNMVSLLSVKDSQLRGCYLYTTGFYSNVNQMTWAFTNNLIQRADLTFNQNYGGAAGDPTRVSTYFRNNTLLGGQLNLNSGSSNQWVAQDNYFDTVSLSASGSQLTNSYNGYRNTTTLPSPTTGNVMVTNAGFQVGVLGSYYYPTNGGVGTLTALVDAGSRYATNAGLRHFTTATNQTPEASSTVDIGAHFVAMNSGTGQPNDTDADGRWDIGEDLNGNGSYDAASGETDWQTYNTLFGVGSGPGLIVFTPLK